MPRCRCSNCDPEGSTRLFNYLQYLKEENFDEAVSCGVPSSVTVPPAVILKCRSNQGRKGNDTNLLSHHATPCPPSDPLRKNDSLKELTLNLLTVFQRLFSDQFHFTRTLKYQTFATKVTCGSYVKTMIVCSAPYLLILSLVASLSRAHTRF